MPWRNLDQEAKDALQLLLDKGYDIEDIVKEMLKMELVECNKETDETED